MTLTDARRLAGLTQHQLDDLARVTRGTVADLERGKNKRPSHETVTRIVRALRKRGLAGVTTDELFPIPDTDTDAATSAAEATR